jgi:hypothetical protein
MIAFVTGAVLGLTQAYPTNHGILLVPAWPFQVRGEPTPEVAARQKRRSARSSNSPPREVIRTRRLEL